MCVDRGIYGPRHKKTCLWGFCQSETQTILLSFKDWLKTDITPVASLHMVLSKM